MLVCSDSCLFIFIVDTDTCCNMPFIADTHVLLGVPVITPGGRHSSRINPLLMYLLAGKQILVVAAPINNNQ